MLAGVMTCLTKFKGYTKGNYEYKESNSKKIQE